MKSFKIKGTETVLYHRQFTELVEAETIEEAKDKLKTEGVNYSGYSTEDIPSDVNYTPWYFESVEELVSYNIIDHNTINTTNGVVELSEDIFQKELFNYTIRDREDYIETLCMWISESNKRSDIELMLADLKMLMGVKDEYVFCSISANKFITEKDGDLFNKTCEEIITINKNL